MKTILILCVTASLSACAVIPQRPIVDMQSVKDVTKYESDLAQCQAYAAQPRDNTGNAAVGGAVVGAGLGLHSGIGIRQVL